MPKPCEKCLFKPELVKIEPKQCNICRVKLDGTYKAHLATEQHKTNKDILSTVKGLIKDSKTSDLLKFVKDSKKHF